MMVDQTDRNEEELGDLEKERRGGMGKEKRKAKKYGRWFTPLESDQSEIPSDKVTEELFRTRTSHSPLKFIYVTINYLLSSAVLP